MIERPVLLDTAAGPVGAVLALPDGPPVAALLVTQGWGGTRAGANQVWTRLARSVVDDGLATLRCDYPGMAESWDASSGARAAALRDAARWFRQETANAPLLVAAHCYGLLPTLAVSRDQDLLGAAMVIPPLFPSDDADPAPRPSATRRARARAGRLRRLPRRAAFRVRYGPAARYDEQSVQNQTRVPQLLAELVRSTPTWMLVGTDDVCRAPVEQLLPELRRAGQVDYEVAREPVLRSAPTPAAQGLIIERVAAWAQRCLARTDVVA